MYQSVILFSGTISGRHESWEFDSGARDLSPEPHSLQKLVEAAAGGTGNMLDLANKVSHRNYLSFIIKQLSISFAFFIILELISCFVIKHNLSSRDAQFLDLLINIHSTNSLSIVIIKNR